MWQVIPGQDLRQWSWDDEAVVYNNLSGDTHLLSADAMQLLQALSESPCEQAALVARLQEAGTDPDPAVAGAVAALLAELEKLSLIEYHAC